MGRGRGLQRLRLRWAGATRGPTGGPSGGVRASRGQGEAQGRLGTPQPSRRHCGRETMGDRKVSPWEPGKSSSRQCPGPWEGAVGLGGPR